MPEGMLKFNLPEDDVEFDRARKGSDYYSLLWDLDQECRKYLKYGHEFETPEDVLEWIRNQIINELES